MNHRLFRLLLFICVIHNAPEVKSQINQGNGQTTVILSLDGFRWDYPAKTSTPGLNRIAKDGVKAVTLVPSFPSKTFPNHYTIATGLYPDHHGLVNNSFYDSVYDVSYAIGKPAARQNPAFYGGEPIWITAMKQGLKTASFFWVGSDVPIQGMHPDYWKKYDGKVPFADRNDTIIKWLGLPDSLRPHLIMAYYHEPDDIGHEFGPDHPETFSIVRYVDSLTGSLYDGIRKLANGADINFIVVSDHGMGEISSERNIALSDFIPVSWPVRIEGGNPNFNLYAKGPYIDSAYVSLKNAKHLKVWKPSEVPGYLNYGSHYRTGNIIVVADSAWSVTLKKPRKDFNGGTHGYDISNTDVHAIFYASGPAFRKNYIQSSFQNIHIYPLLAHLLGINPAKTDGDLKQVIDMLKPEP
jgi:predicted AlkP superfamily pyrophosphatase or phosphodiesterase